MSTDLAAWLLEQIAEDERLADAEDRDYEHTSLLPTYDSDHQQRWNTDRVLAECDAKRRIVDLHHTQYVDELLPGGAERHSEVCATCAFQLVLAPCPTLRALALPYADRPGYREEWRP